MPHRRASLAAVLAFFAGVVGLVSVYGPSRRTAFSPPRVVAVASTGELYELCKASGVKGRRAVVFARHLVPAENPHGDSPEVRPITDLMHQGMVREVFHVLPDGAWAEVERNLPQVSPYRPRPPGFAAPVDEGRVNVDRLSRFWPAPERAIVVVDPAAWSPTEARSIMGMVQSGQMPTDLLVVLGGTEPDRAAWSRLEPSLRR
jgi:hypothetical protein